MANVVRGGWFGTQVSVLLVNGKTITGEVAEVTDHYVVLSRGNSEVQIMGSAIVLVAPSEKQPSEGSARAAADSGPPLFE